MNVPIKAAAAVFSRVFQASRESTKSIAPQLEQGLKSLSKIGTTKMKEFLVAIPLLVQFVIVLVRNREKFESQKKLLIIGVAATLATLLLTALSFTLGSTIFQFGLLFVHPLAAFALFSSEKLLITSIVVFLTWLIIYVLNTALADDPQFKEIRDGFLPQSAQEILNEVQNEVENGGLAKLDELRKVVEQHLMANGSKADVTKVERQLQRIERRLKGKAFAKMAAAVDSIGKN